MFEAIDLYCERTGPELLSEPVNALTNLAFVAAGIWGLMEARRRSAGPFVQFLCWWVMAIGVGSGLFHTFANRLTMLADILPIAIFTIVYTVFAVRRYLRLSWPLTGVVLVAFFGVTGLLTVSVPDWLREASNGSTGYLPAFLGLFVFDAASHIAGHPAGRWLIAAALVFVVSVTARAVDPLVCHHSALGTHFLWHLLNAGMLALLLAAAIRHGGLTDADGSDIRKGPNPGRSARA
jgi:hypothetical protein